MRVWHMGEGRGTQVGVVSQGSMYVRVLWRSVCVTLPLSLQESEEENTIFTLDALDMDEEGEVGDPLAPAPAITMMTQSSKAGDGTDLAFPQSDDEDISTDGRY